MRPLAVTGSLAAFFSLAGTLHFVIPRSYEAIVPPAMPRPRRRSRSAASPRSSAALAVLHPATRRLGRWWLLALLLAVFPANVHMAVNPEQIAGPGPRQDPALGALGAAAAAAAGDALGLARDARLTGRPSPRRRRQLGAWRLGGVERLAFGLRPVAAVGQLAHGRAQQHRPEEPGVEGVDLGDQEAAQPAERALLGARGDAAQRRAAEGEQVEEDELPGRAGAPERRPRR